MSYSSNDFHMVKMADPKIFKTFQGNGNERYEYFCLPWQRG